MKDANLNLNALIAQTDSTGIKFPWNFINSYDHDTRLNSLQAVPICSSVQSLLEVTHSNTPSPQSATPYLSLHLPELFLQSQSSQ